MHTGARAREGYTPRQPKTKTKKAPINNTNQTSQLKRSNKLEGQTSTTSLKENPQYIPNTFLRTRKTSRREIRPIEHSGSRPTYLPRQTHLAAAITPASCGALAQIETGAAKTEYTLTRTKKRETISMGPKKNQNCGHEMSFLLVFFSDIIKAIFIGHMSENAVGACLLCDKR